METSKLNMHNLCGHRSRACNRLGIFVLEVRHFECKSIIARNVMSVIENEYNLFLKSIVRQSLYTIHYDCYI